MISIEVPRSSSIVPSIGHPFFSLFVGQSPYLVYKSSSCALHKHIHESAVGIFASLLVPWVKFGQISIRKLGDFVSHWSK